MKFPVFTPEQIELFFLVFLRISAVVAMLPILGDRTTPARIKGGLAVLITVLVIPFVAKPAEMPADLVSLLLMMAGEVFIGFILGYASSLIFAGIQMAGDLVGFQMGFSIVNIIDPVTSAQVSIIAEFQYLLAGLLFLAVDGHHMLILAVSESYAALPLLGFHVTGELVQSLVELSRELFVIAVKISSPIVIALVFSSTFIPLNLAVPLALLFVLAMAALVAAFVFGRAWCGWLCPMGAWQEVCSPVLHHTVQDGWRNWIKYGVTVLWLAVIAYLFFSAGGIRAVDPFFGMENGLSITSAASLMVVVVIFTLLFIVAYLMGRRGFCHVFCPVAGLMVLGRKIRNLVGWPALQLGADASCCIDCKKCSKECPMGLDVNGMVRSGDMENLDCIMCASCADTCPQSAIGYGVGRR